MEDRQTDLGIKAPSRILKIKIEQTKTFETFSPSWCVATLISVEFFRVTPNLIFFLNLFLSVVAATELQELGVGIKLWVAYLFISFPLATCLMSSQKWNAGCFELLFTTLSPLHELSWLLFSGQTAIVCTCAEIEINQQIM